MENVNVAIIIGRLGRDPEIQSFPNGSYLTKLSVATSERWTDKNTGERRENTEWHRIIAYNVLAKIAFQELRKGDLVYIEGMVKHNKGVDKNNIERIYTEIQAKQLYRL